MLKCGDVIICGNRGLIKIKYFFYKLFLILDQFLSIWFVSLVLYRIFQF